MCEYIKWENSSKSSRLGACSNLAELKGVGRGLKSGKDSKRNEAEE